MKHKAGKTYIDFTIKGKIVTEQEDGTLYHSFLDQPKYITLLVNPNGEGATKEYIDQYCAGALYKLYEALMKDI